MHMACVVNMSVVWFVIGLICLHKMPGVENQQYKNREYSFSSGCPNRASVPAESCQQMASAEWMFLFDLTMWDTPEDMLRSFEAQRRIAHAMFNEMNRTMVFGPKNHQIAVMVSNTTYISALKSLCSIGQPASILIPALDHFKVTDHVNGGITAMISHAGGSNVPSCGRPKNVQRILIIFCNFQIKKYNQQAIDIYGTLPDILQQWQKDGNTAIQPYFVAINDDAYDEVIRGTRYTNFLNTLHDYRTDYPIYGNVFINSYYQNAPVSDTIVTDLSSWLVRCACHKSEDCETVEASRSECYFTWSNAARPEELCVTDVVKTIGFRPAAPQKQNRHTCTAPELRETKNCASFDDCMPSCNQHQWTAWSRCTLTSRGVGQQKRQRTTSNRSRSSFTPHCWTEDLQQCTPVTVPGPTDATSTIVDYETTTEEPETTVVETTTITEPTLISIGTTTKSIIDQPIYGLHPVVWGSIVAAVLVIIFVLLTTVWCMMKKRRSPKRRLIVIGGQQSGAQKSRMGPQSQSNVGSVRSYKQPSMGGTGYSQASGQSYQPQSRRQFGTTVGDIRRTTVGTVSKRPSQGGHYYATLKKLKKGQQKASSLAPGYISKF